MLTDGNITLRALEPTDVDTLFIWENNPDVWSLGRTRAPLSRFQLSEYVSSYTADPAHDGQLRLMICDSEGRAVGIIDLYDYDTSNRRAGVGIMVAPSHRRHGYAKAALALLASYCRDNLALHQLYAIVGETNEPSRHLFETAGYAICGRLRSWLFHAGRYSDAYFYQILL